MHETGTVSNSTHIFGIGGRKISKQTNILQIYSIFENKWYFGSNATYSRYGAACEYSHATKSIYIFGGFDKKHGFLDSIERYHVPSDTWTVLPYTLSAARETPASMIINDFIYILGGKPTPRAIDVFDIQKEKLLTNRQKGELNVELPESYGDYGFNLMIINDTVYKIGGYYNGTFIYKAQLECKYNESKFWSPTMSPSSIPTNNPTVSELPPTTQPTETNNNHSITTTANDLTYDPTNEPIYVPSSQPTLAPTTTSGGSSNKTNDYTTTTTATTSAPSGSPSHSPFNVPSNFPSNGPTIQPSAMQTTTGAVTSTMTATTTMATTTTVTTRSSDTTSGATTTPAPQTTTKTVQTTQHSTSRTVTTGATTTTATGGSGNTTEKPLITKDDIDLFFGLSKIQLILIGSGIFVLIVIIVVVILCRCKKKKREKDQYGTNNYARVASSDSLGAHLHDDTKIFQL